MEVAQADQVIDTLWRQYVTEEEISAIDCDLGGWVVVAGQAYAHLLVAIGGLFRDRSRAPQFLHKMRRQPERERESVSGGRWAELKQRARR